MVAIVKKEIVAFTEITAPIALLRKARQWIHRAGNCSLRRRDVAKTNPRQIQFESLFNSATIEVPAMMYEFNVAVFGEKLRRQAGVSLSSADRAPVALIDAYLHES